MTPRIATFWPQGSERTARCSPLWGSGDHLADLLGERVRFHTLTRDTLEITAFEHARDDGEHFKAYYGPTSAVRANAEREGRAAEFDAALDAFCDGNRRADHCWCLSHPLLTAEIEELGDGSRERAMRRLCDRDHPPGVVAYRDGEAVAWCNIGPRTEITRPTSSRLIRPTDDVPVWSIVYVVVRAGHRRQGVTSPRPWRAVCRA